MLWSAWLDLEESWGMTCLSGWVYKNIFKGITGGNDPAWNNVDTVPTSGNADEIKTKQQQQKKLAGF